MTDFNQILQVLKDNPKCTTREIVEKLSKKGLQIDKHSVNSALYRMIHQGVVRKDESRIPKWECVNNSKEITEFSIEESSNNKVLHSKKSKLSKRITEFVHENDFKILLPDCLISFGYDLSSSPNDPYLVADWLDSHLFISINCQHPFWLNYINSEEAKNFFLLFAAQDAMIQWLAAQRGDNVSSASLNILRDQILRKIAHSTTTD